MSTTKHPITPPPEVVDQGVNLWQDRETTIPYTMWFTQAAQWGADQELEACCQWLPKLPPWSGNDLRKHRRPKPPSLKEQALEVFEALIHGDATELDVGVVRRALEALDD